jgi:hypothetical protein
MVEQATNCTFDHGVCLMPCDAGLDTIHQTVLESFRDLGVDVGDAAEISETVLVRKGHYCGRSFSCGGLRAVWFAEANEIKIYRDCGPVLRTLRLDELAAPRRLAA